MQTPTLREYQRTKLRLSLLQLAPFLAVFPLAGVLAALGFLRYWLADALMVVGGGASVGLMIAAAAGRGPFANAPLMVKARAKHFLAQVLYVAGALAVRSWVPAEFEVAFLRAVVVGFMIVTVGPWFGYGRLGRELTEAVKQDERAYWRN